MVLTMTAGDAGVLLHNSAVSCTAEFARAVERLAAERGSDASALAAATLLLVSPAMAAAVDDPGPGTSTLTVRLRPGLGEDAIRRALALALHLAAPDDARLAPPAYVAHLTAKIDTLEHRNRALRDALERVSFQPLDHGPREVRDAALMFGFPNEWCFDEDRVRRRFRELAPVYHPDTGAIGCRRRMAQLIEARNLLVRHVRTAYASGAWRRAAAV